jgi:hypothetical protein
LLEHQQSNAAQQRRFSMVQQIKRQASRFAARMAGLIALPAAAAFATVFALEQGAMLDVTAVAPMAGVVLLIVSIIAHKLLFTSASAQS